MIMREKVTIGVLSAVTVGLVLIGDLVGRDIRALQSEVAALKLKIERPTYDGTFTVRPSSRYVWPSLGMDNTIALAEALNGAGIQKVAVYCADPECDLLAHDIDDAMQIINANTELSRMRVAQSQRYGITVLATTPEAAAPIIKALNAVGCPADFDAETIEVGTVAIIIGRKT